MLFLLLLLSLSLKVIACSKIQDDIIKSTKQIQQQRYPIYPKYCSNYEEMKTRTIPPLKQTTINNNNKIIVKSQLLQVITIIRHGSRTPLQQNHCWDGYDSLTSDTSNWDCNLKTVLTSPSVTTDNINRDKEQQKDDNSMFLFEKVYDAFENNNSNQSNILNGTCEVGQLLQDGYDQQAHNGKVLQKAYLNTNTSNNMFLFHDNTDNNYGRLIYYRSDDEQRTLMSGQVLLQSFLSQHELDHQRNKISIKVHLTDEDVDTIAPNRMKCPKLLAIEKEAYESQEYMLYNTSMEVKELRQIYQNMNSNNNNKLILSWEEFEPMDHIKECLMTTICTNKTLHPIVNDFHGESSKLSSIFTRFLNHATYSKYFLYLYNHSSYSKLGLYYLFADILDRIITVEVNTSTYDLEKDEIYLDNDEDDNNKHRFLLFSAHDATIMPLLCILFGSEYVMNPNNNNLLFHLWTPYASMFNIEIHAVALADNTNNNISNIVIKQMFRIVYNGQVLTSFIKGCHEDEELCDLDVFTNIIHKFTTNDPQCDDDDKNNDSARFSTTKEQEQIDRIFRFHMRWLVGDHLSENVIISFISFLLGCSLTFCFIFRRYYYLLDISSGISSYCKDDEKYHYTSIS